MAKDDDAAAAQRELDQLSADALAARRAMQARMDAAATTEAVWALMQEDAAFDEATRLRRGPLLDRIFANRPTPIVRDGTMEMERLAMRVLFPGDEASRS